MLRPDHPDNELAVLALVEPLERAQAVHDQALVDRMAHAVQIALAELFELIGLPVTVTPGEEAPE